MKSLLIFFGSIALVVVGSLYIFSQAVYKEPYPVREDTPGIFATPEETLATYVWARNNKDYATYLEVIGENPAVDITTNIRSDMSLWGIIQSYEVYRQVKHGEMVEVKVLRDFIPPSGYTYRNQRVSYFFVMREGRYVMLLEGFDRSILWWKNMLWDLWS